MHLRAPSIDQGVQAFVWSVVFFLFMWLGALAVDVPGGIAFVVSLVAAAAIFLFVRTRGARRPREVGAAWRTARSAPEPPRGRGLSVGACPTGFAQRSDETVCELPADRLLEAFQSRLLGSRFRGGEG